MTRTLIEERGEQDWASEFGRMPRLFKDPDEIPGLTHPDLTFSDRLTIPLGGGRWPEQSDEPLFRQQPGLDRLLVAIASPRTFPSSPLLRPPREVRLQ